MFYRVLSDFSILKPHEYVENISKIDFVALKQRGIKYIVFDKNNTLTLQDVFEFYNVDIKGAVNQAKELFGEENIGILSNTNKPHLLRYCQEKLGLIDIKTKSMKPFNAQDIYSHFKITSTQSSEVCIIGDGLLSDVLMGKYNGMYTIYTFPHDSKMDIWSAKPLRVIEDFILSRKFNIKREIKSVS